MTRRPRILHVITSLAVGGAQRHLLSLLPGLRAFADLDLAYFRDHDLAPQARPLAANLHYLPMAGPSGALRLPRLALLMRRGRYDLVHTHLLRADVYGALAARAAGVRAVVATKHNIEARLDAPHARALHWLATRPTRRTIAISNAVARWGRERLAIPPHRIQVIRYGLQAAPFQGLDRRSARADLGLPPDAPVVLCPARLDPQKRHDRLLRAFAAVRRDLPNALLVCAGDTQLGGPAYRARLQRLTQDLRLQDAVQWLGLRADVPALLAAADVVVLASDWEGLGLALMEAAMAGRPVVATAVGGVPEIVRHPHTGLLVPPANEPQLALALTRLLRDHRLRAAMACAARQHALAEFDLPRMHRATLTLYEQTLAETARRSPPPRPGA